MPCVHLVETIPGHYHWIFEAKDGGIYDSDPACQYCPPDFLRANFNALYLARILTLAIEEGRVLCSDERSIAQHRSHPSLQFLAQIHVRSQD